MRIFGLPLLAGVVAFALGAALIHAALPSALGETQDVAVKRVAVERARSDVDLLFFGSSRVFRQIDPAAVDARLAERGLPMRSYNAALPAAFFCETDQAIRRFLADGPARVRYVVIELGMHDPRVADHFQGTARFIQWHTLDATAHSLRASFGWGNALHRKLGFAAMHLKHLALREGRLGLGPAAVMRLLGEEDAALEARVAESLRQHGFDALDPEEDAVRGGVDRIEEFSRQRPRFERTLAARLAGRLPPDPDAYVDVAALVAQVAAIRAAGLEPIHFVPPLLDPEPRFAALAADGTLPHLLAYDDPARFPELFAAEQRFDKDHLDAEGARALSRRLADDLADVIAGRG